MSGRGNRKRGRPPKTPNDRSGGKFNYQLLKKPKYLSNLSPASHTSSPQESDGGGSHYNYRGSTRGRGRKNARNSHSNSMSGRKGFESEYHYGSDFGDSPDEKSDLDDDILMSECSDAESLERDNVESESEFSLCSFSHSNLGRPPKPPSPEPVWLQGRDYPDLELPESSKDLLVDESVALQVLSIYEVLRRFRHFVRLSPFLFEDFCAALICEEQSALLADAHIQLLKAILREEDAQGTHFAPLDQKDTVNISLYLIDNFTWPEVLRAYVESDATFDREVYGILCKTEYPYTSIENRIKVLLFLTNQFLTTNAVRDVMLQEGPIHYDDHCRVCHRLGDLLCCETCPAVYHLECVDPPLMDVPSEDWQCNLCKSHKVIGVVDCILPQEKQGVLIRHDYLGLDRHGRKFWFMARRIFVEDQLTDRVWYYSTLGKLEQLLKLLDQDDLESRLCTQIEDRKEEIERQFKITEQITKDLKQSRKSYIEMENETLGGTTAATGSAAEDEGNDRKIMTRQKQSQLNNSHILFKIGMDNAFKNYVNQYTVNPIALNKPQRNEERDKRRHLSHKFSLTTASEFKWSGVTLGTEDNVKVTLRQTLMSFEQNISISFMNPNWSSLRKLWMMAIMAAKNPSDFAVVLLVFQACLKNVVFANVWNEQLGHIWLQRITSAEREERKKLEKREKRERDDEEERNRLSLNYIKYSLGLKHQAWKQKGEEYRIHGRWGWMWLSANRRCNYSQRACMANSIDKITLCYTQPEEPDQPGDCQIVTVDPRTYKFIRQCEEANKRNSDFMYLQKFKNIKVMDLTNKYNKAIDVIDVSKALNSEQGRVLYPKIGRYSRLNDLLARREELKLAEEKACVKGEFEEGTTPTPTPTTAAAAKHKKQTLLERRFLRLIEKQRQSNSGSGSTGGSSSPSVSVNLELVNSLAKKIQAVRLQHSQLNRFGKQHMCYTKECNTNSNAVSQIAQTTCYSPMCLQKANAKKNLLLLLRRAHAAGNGSKELVTAILGAVKKPSLLEQKLTQTPNSLKKGNSLIEDCAGGSDDAQKWLDDLPFDILHDWGEANTDAVRFAENVLKECFKEIDNAAHDDSQKEKKASAEAASGSGGVEERMDFMENFDICSNVEVESSDTVGVAAGSGGGSDESAADLLLNNDGAELSSTDKQKNQGTSKKMQKLKNKSYISTKDMLNQAPPENEIQKYKQNRRFPAQPSARLGKRQAPQEERKEYFDNGKERQYSAQSTNGRIYLLKSTVQLYEKLKKPTNGNEATNNSNNANQQTTIIKKAFNSTFPITSSFLSHKLQKNLLLLPNYELRKLARVGGKIAVNGFHHFAKNNSSVWPYPCSRPLFRTCWSYRTSNATTLSAIALHLRILWSCLRWDDMIAKIPSPDGKQQVTTENEIVTWEYLKIRHSGRYGEKTQYLRRKVVQPLEVPKAIREVTSIRSGLRKRKRAESPQPTTPQIIEDWVDEEKLDLWEIRQFGEKVERSRTIAITRSSTLRQSEANTSSTSVARVIVASPSAAPSNTTQNATNETANDKRVVGDQQYKIRIQHDNRKPVDVLKNNSPAVKGRIIGSRKVIVKNPDGTTRIVQQAITSQKPNAVASNSRGISPVSTGISAAADEQRVVTEQQPPPPQQNRIQIIRGPDGKVSVRGLNPGQQLIQMPDGKLHVLTTTTTAGTQNQSQTGTPSSVVNKVKLPMKTTIVQSPSPASNLVTIKQQTPVAKTQTNQLNSKVASNVVISGGKAVVENVKLSSPSSSLADNNKNTRLVTRKSISSNPQATITYAAQDDDHQANFNGNVALASNSTSTQKVIQQIVNTSNVQQPIMVGGQRIVLNPGQTIVTQRLVPQAQSPMQTTIQKHVISNSNHSSPRPSPNQSTTTQDNNLLHATPTTNKSMVTRISRTKVQHDNEKQAQPALYANNSNNSSGEVLDQSSDIAQQLVQGKVQVATINGQQVIVKPLGPNQAQIIAHIESQSDGNSHIVTNNLVSQAQTTTTITSSSKPLATLSSTQNNKKSLDTFHPSQQQNSNTIQIAQSQPTAVVTSSTAANQISNNNQTQNNTLTPEEIRILRGQPPGTIIKCVTAQVIQTDQGPRIVLQGLVGNDFSQQQLALVQQQVKQQLLKAQESSGKQGLLGPTKIYLAVQPAVSSQPPPLASVNVQETLDNYKNNLKVNILKKRADLERSLQSEISSEMTSKLNAQATNVEQLHSQPQANKPTKQNSPAVRRMVNKSKKLTKKKEKLYCICKKPYDDTKFYVGCDMCSNWFHGDCVGISEEQSKNLSEFICSDCKGAREKQELYCSCRQPYDESQFYICCDKCQDWFHGRCVGIVQSEAEFIDEYVCPDCQRNSTVNMANMKDLSENELEELKNLMKQIQSHKSAWPFIDPVDPKEAPDYYEIIKEPMDLQEIERKLNANLYKKLSDVIADMTKIFDNCRYYNPKESSFYKCAESLESYFVQKIKHFRENVVSPN